MNDLRRVGVTVPYILYTVLRTYGYRFGLIGNEGDNENNAVKEEESDICVRSTTWKLF